MPTVSTLDSSLPTSLRERLDNHIASDAVWDQSHPQHGAAVQDAEDLIAIQRMQESPAYFDATHPEHALVKGKVTAFYARAYAGADVTRRPNPIVIETSKTGSSTQSHLMRPKD